MIKSASAIAIALAAVFSMGAIAAPAAPVDQTIEVKVTLEAKCVANNGTTNPVVNFGTYTAFGAASTPAPTANVSFKCSRGLTPTAAFLGTGYTVAGLAYTLGVDTGSKTGANGAIDYDAWDYLVTGAMGAGQAGDGTAAGLQTGTQTLQISF